MSDVDPEPLDFFAAIVLLVGVGVILISLAVGASEGAEYIYDTYGMAHAVLFGIGVGVGLIALALLMLRVSVLAERRREVRR